MAPTRPTAAYRLWRSVRLSRGGRALARAHAGRLTPGRLARHRAAALRIADPSHAGEWMHLERLLARLGRAAGGFAVDLAAGDGVTGSCTLPLLRDREWGGVAIECDPARYARLTHLRTVLPRVKPIRVRVTPSNVVDVLGAAGVPPGFTLLNLDIDSFDLEVASELIPAFRPLVVDMEVNEKVPPPVRFAVRYSPDFEWDEGHCYGCSLAAAADVVLPLGYRLEGVEYNNAFFVRADVAEAGGISSLSVEEAYRAGYAAREDRRRLFPWNADVEELQSLAPERVVEALSTRFRRARASFALQLEPLAARWARGDGADGEVGREAELAPGEVRARFDTARWRGHPAWLWPDTAVGAWREALSSIEGVTADVLAGRSGARLSGDPTAIGIAGYTSGMGPLLGHWIERGEIEASPTATEVLLRHLRHNRTRMARLTTLGSAIVERLAAAGVRVMVTKGMHTAHAYFPEPGTRPLSDIDLEIAPEETAEAERVLMAAGYEPVLVQRNPYKCDWSPVGAARLPRSLSFTHEHDPFTLDVHASLDRNFFGVGVVRLDRLLARAREGRWNPYPAARVPGQPLLTLLLATHASEGLHGLSLIRLVELAWVIRRDVERGALDWREAAEAAEEVGALRFAFPALALCERLAPGSIPPQTLARFAARATPAMLRILGSVTPATAQRLDRLSIEERFMWAGTPAERARRLAYALWPAPAGRSVGELGRIYARRAWRLVQGRVGR